MRLVPLILKGKREFHKECLARGDEGTMKKLASGKYVQVGRPKCMYKDKRHEEVDAFVTGFDPGDEDNGFFGLVGNLRVSCFTENGTVHEVARPANLELLDRIEATVCGKCGAPLEVSHSNKEGKRVVVDINCTGCKANRPVPALNPKWMDRVCEVRGQEWTSRVYRLKHAFIEKWREGADGKPKEQCTVSLRDIQRRFERAAVTLD